MNEIPITSGNWIARNGTIARSTIENDSGDRNNKGDADSVTNAKLFVAIMSDIPDDRVETPWNYANKR